MQTTQRAKLDIAPLALLLARIEERYHPEEVWLFGSRARGDAKPDSDWDLLVVLADDSDDALLDLGLAWKIQRGSGVCADVIPCRANEFREAIDTVNTLAYVVSREGLRL